MYCDFCSLSPNTCELQPSQWFDGTFGYCPLIKSKIFIEADIEKQIKQKPALRFSIINYLLEERYLKTSRWIKLFYDNNNPDLYTEIESNGTKYLCVNVHHLDTDYLGNVLKTLNQGLINCFYFDGMNSFSISGILNDFMCELFSVHNRLSQRIGDYEALGYIKCQSDDPSI
jgi:hypothetical protein